MSTKIRHEFKNAKELLHQEKNKEAFEIFHKLAELDHQESQYYLSWMYRKGIGVEKNPEKAFAWSIEATSKEKDKSSWQLMKMYDEGIGCAVNKKKAEDLYWNLVSRCTRVTRNAKEKLTAAEQFYVEENYLEAFPLFLELAEGGMPEAQSYISLMYTNGYGIEVDEDKAEEWYECSINDVVQNTRGYTPKGHYISYRTHRW